MTKESDMSPEVKEFGLDIRRRREAMGLTVEELAALANISPEVLSAIESGEHEPVLSEALAIAEGLSLEPAVLFGTQEEHSALAEQAGRQLDGLTPDTQNEVLALLQTGIKQETK